MNQIITDNDVRVLKARYSHLDFMKEMWQGSTEPFLVGIHTQEICRLIDEAFEKLRHNESTFLVIKVPFRHGKSQIISRYLPPHFLGEFPDKEVMLITYASSLSEQFSRYARGLMKTPEYSNIYPNVKISQSNSGVQQWGIEGRLGSCMASGLGGAITGKGGSLLILDDYCSSRADAESEVIRNSMWEHFTNDFMTRRAPASIVIVLATPWHTDDIIGRIEKAIDPNSDNYDPEFPPFKVVSFPAKNGNVDIHVKNKEKYNDNKYHLEKVSYEYLFPQRFSDSWYEQQFSTLGTYASSALLQCNPTVRGGNMLDLSKVHVHNSLSEFPVIQYYRIWDLAHSAKQRIKSDPDWTSGTLLAFRKINGVDELWIKNVARIRAEAPERDRFIGAVSDKDGQGVPIGIEISLDARDSVRVLQNATRGRRIIKPIKTVGDKVARMSYLEPIFEAGNVHIFRDEWNLDWFNELREFPSGKHDDQVDNLSAGYALTHNQKHEIQIVRVNGVI